MRDGRVLLVRERTDGGWAMPGGWADPGLTAAQVAVKETAEEAGLAVRATRLLALWDRDAQGMGPYAHAVYKVYLACEPLDPAAEPVPGPEALDAGWFDPPRCRSCRSRATRPSRSAAWSRSRPIRRRPPCSTDAAGAAPRYELGGMPLAGAGVGLVVDSVMAPSPSSVTSGLPVTVVSPFLISAIWAPV